MGLINLSVIGVASVYDRIGNATVTMTVFMEKMKTTVVRINSRLLSSF